MLGGITKNIELILINETEGQIPSVSVCVTYGEQIDSESLLWGFVCSINKTVGNPYHLNQYINLVGNILIFTFFVLNFNKTPTRN